MLPAVQAALKADRFTCIEGCGFCCTFPPAVTDERLVQIEKRVGRRRLGTGKPGRQQLRVQGGCGGCTLLSGRRCSAYDLRPDHCRYFPFHIYFGRRMELYADAACPGLGGTGPTMQQAAADAFSGTPPELLGRRASQAAAVHAEFERRARDAAVWSDPDAAVAAHLARGPDGTSRRGLDELAGALGLREGGVFVSRALRAFRGDDAFTRPTMVLPPPSLEWRTWKLERGRFRAQRLEEGGSLVPRHEVSGEIGGWDQEVVFEALAPLLGRDCFVGSVCDIVDAEKYRVPVEDAAALAFGEVVAEVGVRYHLLAREPGVAAVTPRLLLQSYEHDFLDRPTIGGWL